MDVERLLKVPPHMAPIRLGEISLTDKVASFRREMNREIIYLMGALPASLQTDAVVFFMRHLRTPIVPEFDFFRPYVAPVWSILYWLENMSSVGPAPAAEDRRNARTAHAMALFLHLLDDHLNDGQMKATHLNLLLRSQAWLRMNVALEQLAVGVNKGTEIIQGFIDAYYASIGSPPPQKTLDGYCDHFRNQMATGMNAPVLLAHRMGFQNDFTDGLLAAYGAFGIAWRLMDDWQDLASDIADGSHSAIYFCLPEEIRQLWDQKPGEKAIGRCGTIRSVAGRSGVRETLIKRIGFELKSAVATLDGIQMNGLADELRCLAEPITS